MAAPRDEERGRGGHRECPRQAPVPALGSTQGLRDLSGDGGVRKEELQPGTGPTVPYDATVAVRYSGYLEDGDQPFCTNHSHRFPELMKLGRDITLLGLELGLLSMRKGEAARFVFTPKYAYGQRGCPPLIPPGATVTFQVELLDFLDSAESDSFFELSAEQQSRFPLQKVLEVADTEKQFGNYFYYRRHFRAAKDRYKRAFSILARCPSSEAEQTQLNSCKLLVLLNLSLVYLKLERPARALLFGVKALEIEQSNTKALFRCGQACLCMKEHEQAQDFLLRAQCLEPFNQAINNELKKLASCYRDQKKEEKEMCCRMFASLEPYKDEQ